MTTEPSTASSQSPLPARRGWIARLVVLAVRLAVGGVFVWSGFAKVLAPAQFIRDIWGYRLVPEEWVWVMAAYLPFLEIVAGLALITGLQRRGAHLLLVCMLGVFVAALASAWMRGLEVACGCFGSAAIGTPTSATYAWWIVRDLLLLAGVAVSVAAERSIARSRRVAIENGAC